MDANGFDFLGAGIGAGITVLGAANGVGRLSASAIEAIGRQPEAIGEIRTTMIIAAALIEGIALFSEVICVLLATK